MDQAVLEQARSLLLSDPTIGRIRLSQRIGVSIKTARNIITHLRQEGLLPHQPALGTAPVKVSETIEVSQDLMTCAMPSTRIHTLEELVKFFEIDTDLWECDKFVANKWEMGYKTDVGTAKSEPLYQVKAWFKRKKLVSAAAGEIKQMIEDAKRAIVIKRPPAVVTRKAKSGNMAEIGIYDAHFSKLAWGKESGHEDYDLKIADELYHDAANDLLNRTKGYDLDKIVLVVGNDMLHTDNLIATTTGGTRQDTDSRYPKMYTTARRAITDVVENARMICPVDVLVVPGNHDTLGAFCIGDSLECWFHGASDVKIDNSPIKMKFYHWGDVLIMLLHGDKGKHKDYPLVMATEAREAFGETRFHEIHMGHLHQTRVQEFHGIKVRILPSLVPPDAWHAENLYTQNLRTAEAFVWNKTKGLLGTALFSVPPSTIKVA